MELKDYVAIFQKAWLTVVLGTLLVMIVTAATIALGKTQYDSSVTITVDRTSQLDQKSVPYYLYDNYYAQQSSSLFADTVINWMQSPSVVKDIYASAHVDLPPVRSVAQLGKLFTVKKYPPATMIVSFRSPDADQAKNLLNAASAKLQLLTDDVNASQVNDKFVLRTTEPISAQARPFWALDLGLAAIIGLMLTTFWALLRSYLRD